MLQDQAKESFQNRQFDFPFKVLIIQLLCHAISQIQYGKSPSSQEWELKKIESDRRYENDIDINGNLVTRKAEYQFTYAIYDLYYEGKLVFSIRESADADYLVNFIDFAAVTNSTITDRFFDYAEQLAAKFTRS